MSKTAILTGGFYGFLKLWWWLLVGCWYCCTKSSWTRATCLQSPKVGSTWFSYKSWVTAYSSCQFSVPHFAIAWVLARSAWITSVRKALTGNHITPHKLQYGGTVSSISYRCTLYRYVFPVSMKYWGCRNWLAVLMLGWQLLLHWLTN